MPKAHYLIFFAALLLAACNYTIKIKDGATAYDRKQYAAAIPMLEKEFRPRQNPHGKRPLSLPNCRFVPKCRARRGSPQVVSLAYQNNYGAEALKGQAYSLKKLERYAEAGSIQKPRHRDRQPVRIPQGNHRLRQSRSAG
jgi:peptidoglycan-associated lipoprotein